MPVISGASSGGSGPVVLFSSTLGADTASIDTGAAGIAGGYSQIEVVILARTDTAAVTDLIDFFVNNDNTAIYDNEQINGTNVTATIAPTLADTRWQLVVHGATGSTGYPGAFRVLFPAYAATTFWKFGVVHGGVIDQTAGNATTARVYTLGYRATPAITRCKIAAQSTAKLKAGSALTVYGYA